jgi:hypothetical protein
MDIPWTQTILDTIYKKKNTIMRNTDHILKNPEKRAIVEGLVNPGAH